MHYFTQTTPLLRAGRRQRGGFAVLPAVHDIEEALFLANRVIVFGERPARIKAAIAVHRPCRRHRGDPKRIILERSGSEP